MRLLWAAAVTALLSACSPEYDWREIRSVENGWSVMLPAKPASMTRRIRLDALEVSMTMQGSKVGETAFTVAVADLPDDAPQTRSGALAAMRAGMLRNVGAGVPESRPIQVPVVDPSGAALGRLDAERIDAVGTVKGRPMTLVAGFAGEGRRAWQWVVVGPEVDREQAQAFVEGFRVVRTAR